MTFEQVRASLASLMDFAGDDDASIVNRRLEMHAFTVPGKALPQRFLVGVT